MVVLVIWFVASLSFALGWAVRGVLAHHARDAVVRPPAATPVAAPRISATSRG